MGPFLVMEKKWCKDQFLGKINLRLPPHKTHYYHREQKQLNRDKNACTNTKMSSSSISSNFERVLSSTFSPTSSSRSAREKMSNYPYHHHHNNLLQKRKTRTNTKLFAHPNNKNRMRSNKKVINNTNKLPWALDLALIFNWTDIIDDDLREKNKSLNIFLDGANIAWHRGALLRKKFKCRQFPLSAGVIEALNYEHWLNHKIVAYIPKEYVIGELPNLCDGGGLATVNTEHVKYLRNGIWVNEKLQDLVDEGKIRLVERKEGGDDDLTIITEAKAKDAWICSNDQFRDHKNDKSLPFSGGRSLREFSRLRRFECKFLIAPGLDEKMLHAMQSAKGWEPKVGWQFDASYAEEFKKRRRNIVSSSNGDDGSDGSSSTRSTTSPGRNDNPGALNGVLPFYAMPHEILPCYFEPAPTTAMIEAKKLFEKKKDWSPPFVKNEWNS